MKPRERTQALVRHAGQAITLKRATVGSGPNPTTTYADTPLTAAVYTYRITPESGSLIKFGDRQVIIAAADLAYEPTVQDKVAIDGKIWSIQGVSVFTAFGTVCRYDLQIRK